ncbi:MAG: DUF6787 family protein, partial [Chitinophagaceae bacterium]
MFERLQKKWKVNGIQLTLILCTFAIGGSLTGYTARKLMPVLGIDKGVLWLIIYILLITLLWPLTVLLISFPFGQYKFFKGYLRKIGKRMGLASRQSSVGSSQLTAGSGQSAVGSRPPIAIGTAAIKALPTAIPIAIGSQLPT